MAKTILTVEKKNPEWKNPKIIKKVFSDLESLGFENPVPVTFHDLPQWPAVASVHSEKRVYCVLYDHVRATWVDYFSVRKSGKSIFHCLTNANCPLFNWDVYRPTYFASIPYANLHAKLLFEEFNRTRPKGSWESVSLDLLPDAFEKIFCANENWWRVNNKGKSAIKGELLKIVLDSYERSRALEEKDDLYVLRRLLKRLELTHEMNPPLPKTLMEAVNSGDLSNLKLFLESTINPKESSDSVKQEGYDELIALARKRSMTSPKKMSRKKASIRADRERGKINQLFGEELPEQVLVGKERVNGLKKANLLLRSDSLNGRLTEIVEKDGNGFNLVVKTGDLSLVRSAISNGLNHDDLSEGLIEAAEGGMMEICRELLGAGADPKFRREDQWTALFKAVQWGRPDLVKLLLDAGADPRVRVGGVVSIKDYLTGPYAAQISEMLDQAVAISIKKMKNRSSIRYPNGRKAPPVDCKMGVREFHRDGKRECAIIFVESDPKAVAEEVKKIHPSWRMEPNLEKRTTKLKWPLAMVFRLKGNPWTLIVRSIRRIDMDLVEGLQKDASEFSRCLSVRAISYISAPGYEIEAYNIYLKGKKVEEAVCGEEKIFKSQLKKIMPGSWDTFPQEAFKELGVFVPSFFIDDDGFETWLSIEKVPNGSIEHLDGYSIG